MRHITLTIGKQRIPATLNDTVAAKDFEKRLPFTVTCRDSGIDYCGTAASGRFDPCETQRGWKNGDISLGGGWFSLLYDGETQSGAYSQMMIIGHIAQDNLEAVRQLPKSIRLTIDLAESSRYETSFQ